MKQVEKSHYNFNKYMTKSRWVSLWHQLDEAIQLSPRNILEIGPGLGLFKATASVYGLKVETLDIDPDLEPDHVGSASEIPLPADSYDLVCAFQILEHLPYTESIIAFTELARVSSKYILISLPNSKRAWRYACHIPIFGSIDVLISHPLPPRKNHKFDGEHYWEINKRGFDLHKVICDLTKHAKLIKNYRVKDNPYHHFFLFGKL